nr:MAG TPA: hypothetical protein [Caudoviricetes sp.]
MLSLVSTWRNIQILTIKLEGAQTGISILPGFPSPLSIF